MNAEMQMQLDRVEQALNMLVESIGTYNPSVAAAHQLFEAEEALSGSLERLAQHQTNVAKLKTLKDTGVALDDRIKSSISLLADTRADLVKTTPITLPEAETRTVESEELLGFAQRIARFTVPPLFRPQVAAQLSVTAPGDEKFEDKAPVVNGVDSTAPSPLPTPARAPAAEGPPDESRLMDKLSEPVKALLRQEAPYAAAPFAPWPSPDVIKSGLLGQIQLVKESGAPPPHVDDSRSTTEPSIQESHNQALPEEAPSALSSAQVSKPATATRPPAKQEDEEAFDDFNLYNPDD